MYLNALIGLKSQPRSTLANLWMLGITINSRIQYTFLFREKSICMTILFKPCYALLRNNVYRSYFHPFLDIWAPTISFYYLRDIAQHRRLCLVWLCAFICKVMLNISIIVPNSTIRIIWKGKWIKYYNGIVVFTRREIKY